MHDSIRSNLLSELKGHNATLSYLLKRLIAMDAMVSDCLENTEALSPSEKQNLDAVLEAVLALKYRFVETGAYINPDAPNETVHSAVKVYMESYRRADSMGNLILDYEILLQGIAAWLPEGPLRESLKLIQQKGYFGPKGHHHDTPRSYDEALRMVIHKTTGWLQAQIEKRDAAQAYNTDTALFGQLEELMAGETGVLINRFLDSIRMVKVLDQRFAHMTRNQQTLMALAKQVSVHSEPTTEVQNLKEFLENLETSQSP